VVWWRGIKSGRSLKLEDNSDYPESRRGCDVLIKWKCRSLGGSISKGGGETKANRNRGYKSDSALEPDQTYPTLLIRQTLIGLPIGLPGGRKKNKATSVLYQS
jgi:hypothetical protein